MLIGCPGAGKTCGLFSFTNPLEILDCFCSSFIFVNSLLKSSIFFSKSSVDKIWISTESRSGLGLGLGLATVSSAGFSTALHSGSTRYSFPSIPTRNLNLLLDEHQLLEQIQVGQSPDPQIADRRVLESPPHLFQELLVAHARVAEVAAVLGLFLLDHVADERVDAVQSHPIFLNQVQQCLFILDFCDELVRKQIPRVDHRVENEIIQQFLGFFRGQSVRPRNRGEARDTFDRRLLAFLRRAALGQSKQVLVVDSVVGGDGLPDFVDRVLVISPGFSERNR